MTYCDWEQSDDLAKPHYNGRAFKCVKCGAVSPKPSRRRCPVRGMGDIVESVIKTVLPFVKTCGGCKRRRQYLNKLRKG